MSSRPARCLEVAQSTFLVWIPDTHTTDCEENHLCVCQTADGTEERPLGGGDKGHVRGA